MQDILTSEEWRVVQCLPLNVGVASASADAMADDADRDMVVRAVGNREWISEPMAREVLESRWAQGPVARPAFVDPDRRGDRKSVV